LRNVWIYPPKATPVELQTNGLGVLDASAATVHEELNGEFSITLTVPKASRNIDAVVGGAIVKADTPRGPQFFRLTQPTAAESEGDSSISAFGWHISYDLAQDIILDRHWTAKTGAEALPDILQAGISERRFTGTSDIELVANMYVVRTSVLAALIGDGDNTFLKRWGGEIERDNFTVNMLSRLGAETGVEIRYRKNLVGLTLEENHDDIVNRVVPVGRTATDTPLLLPEVYIDSPRISDTPVPHVRELDCADVQVGAEDTEGNRKPHIPKCVRVWPRCTSRARTCPWSPRRWLSWTWLRPRNTRVTPRWRKCISVIPYAVSMKTTAWTCRSAWSLMITMR